MGASSEENFSFPTVIDQIETDWAMIHEPAHLVMRYSRAVEKFLRAIMRNAHDAEEVGQEFFLLVSKHGLPRLRQDRGRFRDYLKQCVRNAARNSVRRSRPNPLHDQDVAELATAEDAHSRLEQEWIAEWRRCILDRAWERLREHQKKSRRNFAYDVLQLQVANLEDSSEALAEKLAAQIQRPVRPEMFRQQLSRARRQFAQFLVDEVAQTLSDPEPLAIEEELADLGLIQHVRSYLPLRKRVTAAAVSNPTIHTE